MLRNDCDSSTTYAGTTKITTTSAAATVTSSSIQWSGGASGEPNKGAGDDMQRNHMLDAIAVGVVFCLAKNTQKGDLPCLSVCLSVLCRVNLVAGMNWPRLQQQSSKFCERDKCPATHQHPMHSFLPILVPLAGCVSVGRTPASSNLQHAGSGWTGGRSDVDGVALYIIQWYPLLSATNKNKNAGGAIKTQVDLSISGPLDPHLSLPSGPRLFIRLKRDPLSRLEREEEVAGNSCIC